MLESKEIFNELIKCDRELLDKKLPVKTKLRIQAEADTLRWVLDKDLDEPKTENAVPPSPKGEGIPA
jgi:hypothetical protein